MTIQEVAEEIHKDFKAYVGVMSKFTFFTTIRRIKMNKAKPSTIKAFFEKFGYIGEYNEWHKWPPQ